MKGYGLAAVYALAFMLFVQTYFTACAAEMNVFFPKDSGDEDAVK